MNRSIRHWIYFVGLLPLAALAVTLVIVNGIARIADAERELRYGQRVAVELLHPSAAEALVVGNVFQFHSLAKSVVDSSPTILCISLRDTQGVILAQAGECSAANYISYESVRTPHEPLSDFQTTLDKQSLAGGLAVVMNDSGLGQKQHAVLIQLALSLLLIVAVAFFAGRVMRDRLIDPIARIDSAMRALRLRDYSVSVSVEGRDELARLATEINHTVSMIAAYTKELEQRRADAEGRLHEADEANLARDALVRSLTEDFAAPMARIQIQLTDIARANTDARLREQIKTVIATLVEDRKSNV